jgi:PIN domain of ribonuclease
MVVEHPSPGQGSWAAVAVSEPAKQSGGHEAEAVSDKPTAVIDANAIMSGVPLGSLADRLVTIPEVLEEIRDVKTRERLAALHVVLETLQPTDEAVAAGV